MLKEQRFGVEVEMTGITRKKAAEIRMALVTTLASSETRRTANGKL